LRKKKKKMSGEIERRGKIGREEGKGRRK